MFKSFQIVVIACTLHFSLAHAQNNTDSGPIVLSSGVAGGGYWNAGERLRKTAADMNLGVENRSSEGSMDNISQLLDPASDVSLAFSQADAALHYVNQNEGALSRLDLLESIGQECVFVVVAADSGIETLSDLEDESAGLKLGIKSAEAGIAVTFDYLASQIEGLKDIDVVYGDTAGAVQDLAAGRGELDAVMVVHRPREHSPEVDAAIANQGEVVFLAMNADKLGAKLPNGEPVYQDLRLALPGKKEPLQTICTKGLLFANKYKLSIEERNKLTDLVSYRWMDVYVTP